MIKKRIKIVRTNEQYWNGGGKIKFDEEYDYLLFRQDFFGTESVYFNQDNIPEVLNSISRGSLLIHPNYSILFAKTKRLKEKFPDIVFKDVWDEKLMEGKVKELQTKRKS